MGEGRRVWGGSCSHFAGARAQLQVGKFSCACRSAPPTLETMRPKQEWEMRLNRIRMTKESVRVSSCRTAPSLTASSSLH